MSFPRYPRYKNSGVQGLGDVPEHWRIAPLKTISTHNDEVLDESTHPDAEIAYVDISSVDWISGIKTKEMMQFSAAPSRARRRVKHGDVIVSTVRTYLKAIARIREPKENLVVSTGFAVIRPSGELVPDFLGYLVSNSYFVDQVIARSSGVSYPAINASELVAIPVAVPPVAEQATIAAYLDRETVKIDELAAEQQRLMDLLKEKRQAVISHAVIKGLNSNAPMKPSGTDWLGDVPAHWETIRLHSLFQQVKRQNQSGKQVLSVYREYGVILKDSRDDNLNKTPDDLTAYQLVNPGDLVVNKMKAWQGSLGVSELEGITSPDYVVFAPRHKESTSFLHWLLRSQRMVSVYRSISNGIRPAQWRLEPDSFLNLRIPLPPKKEQCELVSYIVDQTTHFDALAADAGRAIDLLQERRTALISAAVTGRIDVRGKAAGSSPALKPYARGFARQLLAAEILSHCHHHPTTGRVKLQKLLHLCEHVAEIEEVEADYFREAAGPFDNKLMFGIATGLSRQRWFSEVRDGKRTFYKPLEKAGEHAKYLARWENKMPKIHKVLDLLGKADTQQCEIVSTLYAAWNDLLIEKQLPSDAEIIREASDPERWHESKLNIHVDKWPIALSWMREKGLVPSGFGTHTKRQIAPKESA